MKIFDFTNGTKGKLLGECKRMNASGGWLVRKDDKVYRVELSAAPEGWQWANCASYLQWVDGEPGDDISIRPEDYGVGAICFCWGKTNHDNVWNWNVIGTTEWNREACRTGILKFTFSHMFTKACSGHPDHDPREYDYS